MKKIKIIDFLNRYAKKNLPKRFIYKNVLWCLGKKDTENYYADNYEKQFGYVSLRELNDEIEILDEDFEQEEK